MTIRDHIADVLREAKTRLAGVSSSASLDAQILLMEVLAVNRAYVLAHPEHSLTPEQAESYQTLVTRRTQGEPIAYLLGRKPFYDRELIVSPAVLIPRPETELLLEWALDLSREHPAQTVVDVGTGSGALAVTFAAHRPQAAVYATDISAAALEIAQANALKEAVKVTFLQGDLLMPLIERDIQPTLVLANLPYIARDEIPTLEVSRYEPILALDGGADGLDLIRLLLMQVKAGCPAGARVLLEIGADQGTAVVVLAEALGYVEVELRKDYAGLDRMVGMSIN